MSVEEYREWHSFSPPAKKEGGHPSFLQQTVRSLLTPILLGGAVAATTLPLPAKGDDPIKEEKKAEDPALTKLRQEIPSLITDLDHKHFLVREQAQRRLQQMSTDWVRTKQTPFPLLPLLQPTREYSSEQRRRLESILAAHEHEELQLLWRPTRFQEPPEWKGRKDAPRVREVLEALEKQTGEQFRLEGDGWEKRKHLPITDDLHQRSFWEIIEIVRRKGEHIGATRYSKDTVTLKECKEQSWTAMADAAYLHLRSTPSQEKEGDLHFYGFFEAEKRVELGHWSVVSASCVADTGEEVPLVLRQGHGYSGWCITFDMPPVLRAKSVEMRFDVLLEGYQYKEFPIDTAKLPMTMKTDLCQLDVGLFHKNGDWELHAIPTSQKLHDDHLFHYIRCRGVDAGGKEVTPGHSGSRPPLQLQWGFPEIPPHVTFSLPSRQACTTKTFRLKGVPLR